MMYKNNKVLLIGVDTTKLKDTGVTEFDSATIRKEAEDALQTLLSLGYDAKWHLIDVKSNISQTLTDELKLNDYDCIMVGAGIRRRPETLNLFELIINVIHFNAHKSKICFNADVYDTIPVIQSNLKLS